MRSNRLLNGLMIIALLLGVLPTGSVLAGTQPVARLPQAGTPTSVTIAGSLQSELGCAGDWDPACAAAHLSYDAGDDTWQGTWTVPAGGYEYKAALNDSWTENYGLHAAPGGANIPLNLGANTAVKFYYDHKSHWITDNQNSVIAVAPGSFQSELGCAGDWDPSCLRSWLQDVDGDGLYTFETTALPAGNYEGKVALNESWDVNYGQGGVPGGANLAFTVPVNNAKVSFRYDSVSHVLTILAGHAPDNNVEWDGLRHDSRDTLYRTPGGAVPAGTPVTLRFRTFHNDVTSVKARVYDLDAGGQQILPMAPAATDVACYQPGLETETCDFWSVTLNYASPDNLWYRFIVADGTQTAYYADNTAALDGGLGAPGNDPIDNSYALMIYDPAFTAPDWASRAVIYQIFPDRFNNGTPKNDPKTGDVRYDDPMIKLPWGTLPEGFCRNYADGATNCPWRFDPNPPASSPDKEQPRGRDYMGGDLLGVTEKLLYLKSLGVTAIYFNPIFWAKSNHRYDTADYFKIDPALGTLKDFQLLTKAAKVLGIRVILDGVFNHMSSDSPFFDRYHHSSTVGACEDVNSDYRAWFVFREVAAGTGTCAGSAGPNSAAYEGWFGFDSIPVLNKSNPQVQAYFLTDPNSVSRYWLNLGAASWRMDVMGDASFPAGYWETFRQIVKGTRSDALIISETWQKDSTLLRMLRGDRADTTMNYRLRDAVIGLLTPGGFDSKGFADSGRSIAPSEFAARILSIREDYPDAAYYSLMNLLDSHDTERLLWTLTPGTETTADKEQNAANVADGQRRVELASLIQFTLPGAPTVYYGDEVGLTGDDDPDDRRTFPWSEASWKSNNALLQHYRTVSALRHTIPSLTGGDLRMLVADDVTNLIAYGRKTDKQASVVVINRGTTTRTVDIPVAGYLPDGVKLLSTYAVGKNDFAVATVTGGILSVTVEPLGARLLVSGRVDLAPPAAPTGLQVTNEGNAQISLAWTSTVGAASYNVYRSPVSGGGWIKVNSAPVPGTAFTDTGLRNARLFYYVVRALDAVGNESAASNEVNALPHLVIGWANLQWPPTMNHTISAIARTDNAYGQVWIDGATNQPGATDSLRAELGFGPTGSNPANNPQWTWVTAAFNVDAGNNDEFVASLLPDVIGSFDYVYRYTTTNGRDWLYADLNGPIASGANPPNPGKLTVNVSADTTPPAIPTGLQVVAASPAGIELAWDAILGDPTLYGYEVLRSDTAGGPYTPIALVTVAAGYTDANVVENATYYYVVRAVDTSFNRSANTAEVAATATLRTVSLVFNVTVPATTDATGRSVNIAGFLDRLDGGWPQWNPGGAALTRTDATHWTITFTGKETTQIEYKYTLGDWDHVEKDNTCGEIANRQLTLSFGSTGVQTINDIVPNWRNVAPCGN
ncbi:MAG: alpha-amylase [Chloroflexi bacterium]|nr:alpha-amylase [Chloroflexota bacterium]